MEDEAKRTALLNALQISALQRYTDPARDVQAILEPALLRRSPGEFFDGLAGIEKLPYAVQIARNKCDRILRCIEAKEAVASAPVTRGNLYRFYRLSVSDSPLAPSAGNLDDWLEALADMADRDTGFSRLEEFIERVYRASKAQKAGEWLESLTPQKREDIRVFLDEEVKFATQPKPYIAIMISTTGLKPDEQPRIEAWLSNGDENHHWVEPCEPKEEAVRDKCLGLLSEARALVGLNLSVEFLVPNEQLRMAPETWEIVHPYSPASTLGHDHTVVMRWRERVRETELTANWLNRASAIQDRIQSGLTPVLLWASLKEYDYFSLRDKLVKKEEPGDCIAFEFVPQKNAAVTADNLLLAAMVGGAPFLYVPESEPQDWNALKKDLGELARLGLEEIPGGLKKMRVKARLKLAECGTLIWDDPSHLPRPARLAPAGQQTS